MAVTDAALRSDALYHLATEAEWEQYRTSGSIAPESLRAEGFVHCSWGRQVAGTVDRHFTGVTGLLALVLAVDRLGSEVVEEDSYGSGQTFPHVYGPIPTEAVVGRIQVT